MGLKLSNTSKGSGGVVAPAGSNVARCYSVVDLGTHTEDGKFGVQTQRKVRVSWELPEELHVFKEESGPQPLAIHREYNFSGNEKSALRKDLGAWRGKEYTDKEIADFDIETVIGDPALLNIVHVVSKTTGNTYAKITGISKPPKSTKVPAAINPPVYYDIDMGQNTVFNDLPEFIRKRILSCNEWNGDDQEEETSTANTSLDENFLGGKDESTNPF